jgi:RNA polymerase sigma factor (sigma-70 family)
MKPASTHTDAELVIALNRGDRQAFEIIYRMYVNDLFRYARKNIPMKEECEEMVQDVFVSLWTKREHIKIIALKPYLFSMVRYKMIRYFQHEAVRKRYAQHYKIFESLYHEIGDNERPDAEACKELINQKMSVLPERVQVVARMRLNENLTNGEIAERLKITRKTVENYVIIFTSHFKGTIAKFFET